jgi:hypothetical protein
MIRDIIQSEPLACLAVLFAQMPNIHVLNIGSSKPCIHGLSEVADELTGLCESNSLDKIHTINLYSNGEGCVRDCSVSMTVKTLSNNRASPSSR